MQVLLMDASEGPQVRPERCCCPLAGVAVDLADPIPIRISRPLVHAVADGGVGRMAATIALPLIGIQPRTAGRHVVGDEVVTGPRVSMITHSEAVLAGLPRDHADNGGGDRWHMCRGPSTYWYGGVAGRRGQDGGGFFSPAFW
jgi:hypothetical protein